MLPAALLTGRASAGRARERRTRRVVDVPRVRGHACGPSARSSPRHVSDWCHTLSSKLLWSLRAAGVPDLSAACMQRCQGAKVWATGWNKVEGLPRGELEAPKSSGRSSTAHFPCTGLFAAAVAGASQVQHISSNIPPGCCNAAGTRLLPAAQQGLRRSLRAAVQPHLSRERVPEAPKRTLACLLYSSRTLRSPAVPRKPGCES